MSIQFSGGPAQIASEVLGGASMLGAARGSVTNVLGGATKALLGVDLADQEIPFLGEVTDGLTVAAGIGSLVASAFEGTGKEPDEPAESNLGPSIGGSYGT
tara:strand:+ start:101 stop:403 length:303 start_codon:yes stop_codon:yes gene_type:complete